MVVSIPIKPKFAQKKKSKRGVNAIYDVFKAIMAPEKIVGNLVNKKDLKGLKKVANSLLVPYPEDVKLTELSNIILTSSELHKGLMGTAFTEHLMDFIKFILSRYSPDNSFGPDMVHFAYCRVMERLGRVKAEKPSLSYDEEKNKEKLEKWEAEEVKCLFDVERSNLGNYIFSIVRNAHSNWTYHNLKKINELNPPPKDTAEASISYDSTFRVSKVLKLAPDLEEAQIPSSLRRYVVWISLNS